MSRYLYTLICTAILVVPGAVQWQLLYVCQMDGQVRESCCCPQPEDENTGTAIAAESASCCDVSINSGAPPAVFEKPTLSLASTLVAAPRPSPTWPAVRVPPQAATDDDRRARAPPHEQPPLFLQHQIFLI